METRVGRQTGGQRCTRPSRGSCTSANNCRGASSSRSIGPTVSALRRSRLLLSRGDIDHAAQRLRLDRDEPARSRVARTDRCARGALSEPAFFTRGGGSRLVRDGRRRVSVEARGSLGAGLDQASVLASIPGVTRVPRAEPRCRVMGTVRRHWLSVARADGCQVSCDRIFSPRGTVSVAVPFTGP